MVVTHHQNFYETKYHVVPVIVMPPYILIKVHYFVVILTLRVVASSSF